MKLILSKQDKRNLLNSGKILHIIKNKKLLLFNKIITFILCLRERERDINETWNYKFVFVEKYYDKLQNNNNFSMILIIYNFSKILVKNLHILHNTYKKIHHILKNLI